MCFIFHRSPLSGRRRCKNGMIALRLAIVRPTSVGRFLLIQHKLLLDPRGRHAHFFADPYNLEVSTSGGLV
jgi:hypothetical protein